MKFSFGDSLLLPRQFSRQVPSHDEFSNRKTLKAIPQFATNPNKVALPSLMNEEFEIPVSWNNKPLHFPAKLLQYGYSYKIEVDINGTKLMFEPDEERNWRALVSYEELESYKAIDKGLLEAIAGTIEEILK